MFQDVLRTIAILIRALVEKIEIILNPVKGRKFGCTWGNSS
jgi:hypothetical protein